MDQLNNRTLTIQRTLKAPLGLVWEAWTQPEHISKWWGPKNMEVEVLEHHFKVGGAWRYKMNMPNGQEFITEGVLSEIIALERIVTTAEFKPMTEGVELQILFEAKGEDTLFTFNVIHPTAEYAQQQEKMGFYNGWGSVFDNLEAFLQQATV